MSATDDLLSNNEEYAARFDLADLPAMPRTKVAVVTCMDARVIPTRLLGLQEGDAHVIRNAGGVITDDEIRSLAISQHELGTEEIVLIRHTDCGLLKITDDEFKDKLERSTGRRPEWHSGAFQDLETSVRDSITQVVESPFIPHTGSVRGFVYEVETGRLREVA
jgi:carbonic anhydrase